MSPCQQSGGPQRSPPPRSRRPRRRCGDASAWPSPSGTGEATAPHPSPPATPVRSAVGPFEAAEMPSGSASQPVAWSKREEAPKTTRSIARLMGDLAARGRLSQVLRPAANRSRRPSQRTGTDRNPDEEVRISLLEGCLRLPLLLRRGLPPRRLPLGRRLLGGGLLCSPALCWHGITSSQGMVMTS